MYKKLLNRGLTILIFFSLILPVISFSQTSTSPAQMPENLEEAKQMGEKILEETKKEMPGIIEKTWNEDVLPIWKKMYEWVKIHIWNNWLGPWASNTWETAKNIFKDEAERRKPAIEEEFQKEKQEIKQEAPVVGKTLLQKFLELIK